MKDDQIKNLDAKTIQLITDKIIEGVLGHMLEDANTNTCVEYKNVEEYLCEFGK